MSTKTGKTTLRIKNPKAIQTTPKRTTYFRPAPSMIPVERKNFDIVQTLAGSPNNGSSGSWYSGQLLNPIPQGAGQQQRVGRKIKLLSFSIRATLANSSGAPTIGRVLVVYDNQFNGAQPVVADVLANPTSSESLMNLSNGERFKVIADFYINQAAGGGNGFRFMHPLEYRRLNLDQTFGTLGTGLAADITKGGLILFWTSNLVNTDTPTLTIATRVRYADA